MVNNCDCMELYSVVSATARSWCMKGAIEVAGVKAWEHHLMNHGDCHWERQPQPLEVGSEWSSL